MFSSKKHEAQLRQREVELPECVGSGYSKYPLGEGGCLALRCRMVPTKFRRSSADRKAYETEMLLLI
jgi:hypothetical protein